MGNKADMSKERTVTYDEGKRLADRFGVAFYETSAKDNTNVSECFEHLAKLAKERLEKHGADQPAGRPNHRVDVRDTPDKSKGCCK